MRKFFIIILVFTLLLTGISGCKNEENLFDFVSELRCEIYQGSSENFSVKAVYGFKEQPFNNDGKVGELVYGLTFKILDKETEMSSYSLNFSVGEQTYRADFKLNPINDTLSAFVEIEDFPQKEFTINLCSSGNTEKVLMSSILPQNAIDCNEALIQLSTKQSQLLNNYRNQNGLFCAEIYARIIVKDNNPYWYIGIASGGENLKALLVDGISGEILAVREIF